MRSAPQSRGARELARGHARGGNECKTCYLFSERIQNVHPEDNQFLNLCPTLQNTVCVWP